MKNNIEKLIKNLHFENHRADFSEMIIAKSMMITQNLRYNFKNETYLTIFKSLFILPQTRLALALLAVTFFVYGFTIQSNAQSLIVNIYYPFGDLL